MSEPRNDKELKTALKKVGVCMRKRDGEYRVVKCGRGQRNDDAAYFTDDRSDAFHTGLDIAQRAAEPRIQAGYAQQRALIRDDERGIRGLGTRDNSPYYPAPIDSEPGDEKREGWTRADSDGWYVERETKLARDGSSEKYVTVYMDGWVIAEAVHTQRDGWKSLRKASTDIPSSLGLEPAILAAVTRGASSLAGEGAWYTGSGIKTLSQGEVRTASAELKAEGKKLPRVGWCMRFNDSRELCRDAKGYYWANSTPRVSPPIAGLGNLHKAFAGLGSKPDVHVKKRDAGAQEAKTFLNAANRELTTSSGDCTHALQMLVGAAEAAGETAAHNMGLTRSRKKMTNIGSELLMEVMNTRRLFAMKCVRPGLFNPGGGGPSLRVVDGLGAAPQTMSMSIVEGSRVGYKNHAGMQAYGTVQYAGGDLLVVKREGGGVDTITYAAVQSVVPSSKKKVAGLRGGVDGPQRSMTYGEVPTFTEFEKHFEAYVPDGMFRFSNDKRVGTDVFTAKDLYAEIQKAAYKWSVGDDEAGDWVSSVLSVLGFEWI